MTVEVYNSQLLPTYRVAADIIDSAQNQWIIPRPFATRVDEVSASLTYVGWAVPGTLDAAATWRVMRMSVTGTVTAIEWADGDESFDNVWSSRAGLSYS